MAIRTKKYVWKWGTLTVRAIKITNKNLADIVAYVCRNGGAATGHGDRPEFKRPARIRIKQICFGGPGKNGGGWGKRDWRVARIGDYIVRHENGEFERVKYAEFEDNFELVK